MNTEKLINGPEDLIAGHFYHHSGLRGILYFAACQYWLDPASGKREPQPGTEVMYTLNGEIPGAYVVPPDDGEDNKHFWNGFYPAPGLLACEAIMDGMASVAGYLKAIEDFAHEASLDGLKETTNNAMGQLQRTARTVQQIGHENYTESRPIEIQAKDKVIGQYVEHINRLHLGLGDIVGVCKELCATIPQGTRSFDAFVEICNRAAGMTHLSPFHPEKRP